MLDMILRMYWRCESEIITNKTIILWIERVRRVVLGGCLKWLVEGGSRGKAFIFSDR